ncbi:hypothetical protein [Nocardia sp. CY41]|uniref:hypothetical protein n=1 Tax=Nocardia sp. CY41 TaxID=2608686 RepID=UPI0013579731|nr:hypothetical protein [Nocardia sp. CY41]
MSEGHPLARRLDDGRILLRYFTQEPDGSMIHGSIAIGPDDPAYANWDTEITRWKHNPIPVDDSIDYEPIDYDNLPSVSDLHPGNRD